ACARRKRRQHRSDRARRGRRGLADGARHHRAPRPPRRRDHHYAGLAGSAHCSHLGDGVMTLWFTARGAGLSALLLLSISTALGALMTGRTDAAGRVVWHYVHRITASLGLAVLALHITTILADPFAHVGWKGALI